VPVVIRTTPNPKSGYSLVVPEEDVIALDISVDEGIKVIISGGPVGDLPARPPGTPRT
jgi:uncharacterized membrane protein